LSLEPSNQYSSVLYDQITELWDEENSRGKRVYQEMINSRKKIESTGSGSGSESEDFYTISVNDLTEFNPVAAEKNTTTDIND
jgi:hypothetical protein